MRGAVRLRNIALIITSLVVVTACGSSGSPGSTGAAKGPIKIGFILPLSGTFASNGKNEQNGWKLAQKDFGTTVAGRTIQTLFTDDQTDPSIALTDARQLVETQGVTMLEGPIAANAIGVVANYAGPRKMPVDDISLCSAAQFSYYATFGNAYSSDWNCDQPAIMAAKWFYDTKGYRHVTTIGLDYAFGWINVGTFVHAFEQLGGHIDKMLWAPITTADYSPFIPQIPTSTQAVFALAAGTASARLTKAYASFGLKAKIPLIGTTTLTDYSALPAEDPNAILGVNVAAQYCDGIPSATNTKFANEYFAAYNTYPGYYSDAGYTKYRLLITALRALNGDTSNPQKLIHTLKSTPIEAPRGPVTLNPATWSPNENIYICQVENVNGTLRNVPIHTYDNVKPWGYLPEAQWKTWFAEDAKGRPTA